MHFYALLNNKWLDSYYPKYSISELHIKNKKDVAIITNAVDIKSTGIINKMIRAKQGLY